MKPILSIHTREWVLRNPAGQEMLLRLEPGQSASVGRDLTSDISILDAGVSRHHASITLERDEDGNEVLWVEDLHSHNGTFVNTERVHRAPVHPGDLVTFGRVPVIVTERPGVARQADPLSRVAGEKLSLLTRLARDLAAEPEQRTILQRLVKAAVEALDAERGAVLLLQKGRSGGRLDAVAALPAEMFHEIGALVDLRTAESILRAGEARLLRSPAATASRITPAVKLDEQAPSAAAAPLSTGTEPVGILYVDRGVHGKPLEARDAELLGALAWVSAPALSTSSHISSMRDWNQRLEALVTRGAGGLEASGTHPAVTVSLRDDIPRLLRMLENSLLDAAQTFHAKREPLQGAPVLERALRSACVKAKGIRCLSERHSTRMEEVQVGHALRESASRCPDLADFDMGRGRELSVVCSPDELFLSLELAVDWVLQEAQAAGEGGRRLVGSAAAQPGGSNVQLRLALSPAPAARRRRAEAVDPGASMSLEILKHIVRERLRGDVHADDGGQWIELRLPRASVALHETASYPKEDAETKGA